MYMRFLLHKKIPSIVLGFLLCFVSIAHGCNASVLTELSQIESSTAQDIASADAEPAEEKFCTCSLKKQADDFFGSRFSQKEISEETFDTDDLEHHGVASSFEYLLVSGVDPPPFYTQEVSRIQYRWAVTLPRAHLS